MRPDLEDLKAACPETDPRILEEHLSRLEETYFERFPAEQVCRHVAAFSRIGPDHPVELLLEDRGGGQVDCTVLGFDYRGVFSLITGIFTATGYSITSGDVFTYAPKPPRKPSPRVRSARSRRRKGKTDPLHRRRIVNHFSGILGGNIGFEAWAAELRGEMEKIFLLLEQGDPKSEEEARHRVNTMVVKRLIRLKIDSQPVLYPVLIDIDNASDRFTRLRIVSEDTPAFLYSLTQAFSLHGVSIEHVRIRTLQGRIEDEIDIVDAADRKIEDPEVLQRIQVSVLLTKQFTYFLGKAPDPYAALTRFNSFVKDILRLPSRDQWLKSLSNPYTLRDLAVLLGTSDFLWEDFIRLHYEALLPMLQPLVRGRRFSQPAETIPERLREALAGARDLDEQAERLNRFKDQEIFLIDLDHILNPEINFVGLSEHLTRLAEAVVSTAAELAYRHLEERFGTPETAAGLRAGYAVLGLGKLGGAALGYASDIEILLVYSDSGSTSGEKSISNAEFFDRMVHLLNRLIRAKREGIFQLDLRLRPYGNAGPMACSLDAFCQYYGQGGPAHAYERLALVRLRAVGGDPALGARIERLRDEMIYGARDIDLEDLRALREKQVREKTRPGRYNAKFNPGGLVDLEYTVQILQILHGNAHPRLRTPLLHQALAALADAGVLPPQETARLLDAYDFLRRLINAMRMLRGSAKDLFLPPADSPEFEHLARRMGYRPGKALEPAQQLHLDYETHTAAVRAFAERHFGRVSLLGPGTGSVADLVLADRAPPERVRQVLARAGFSDHRRAYRNLRGLAGTGSRRHTFAKLALLAFDILSQTPDPDMALNNWERFIHALPSPEFHYNHLLAQPMRLEILLNIFSRSQFLADTLIRSPGTLDWLILPEILHRLRGRGDLEQELEQSAERFPNHGQWLNHIRRFRRREILRIGTRDMVLGIPTREIMLELSNLAEALTRAVLRRTLDHRAAESGTGLTREQLEADFCILAFGKLGGRELNYSSDIDLLGLFNPPGGPGRGPWTEAGARRRRLYAGIMEAVGRDLSRHTEEGSAYRVDLRLRPYGKAGDLVPSLEGLLEYYRREASVWEIQAALKLRPVAGNLALGEAFLEGLRPILLQPRSAREIIGSVEKMRLAAIRERVRPGRSATTDVKSGEGGLRDVEFLAQGLQLIHAHRHPELLEGNTLAALQRLREAGILPADTIETLAEDYLFLRRVEHYLQILEDRQTHTLPSNPRELRALARRILGKEADEGDLLAELDARRERIREAYRRHLLEEGARGGST